jgi:hypothetical protein
MADPVGTPITPAVTQETIDDYQNNADMMMKFQMAMSETTNQREMIKAVTEGEQESIKALGDAAK